MSTKLTLTVTIALALCGCTPLPAVIVDLETDKVVVHKRLTTTIEEVKKTAREGCALHNRIPKHLSRICADQNCFHERHLFACVEQ